MATLTFTFDTGDVPVDRILDGMATTYGYIESVPDPENPGQTMENPETKLQFAKKHLKRIITEAVYNGELVKARLDAEVAVEPIDIS